MQDPDVTMTRRWGLVLSAAVLLAFAALPAQQMVTETRDPAQPQDEEFARLVKEWTTRPYFISPLVDHLPLAPGIPTPKDVLGYHIGAPARLTYYDRILEYYRALAAATPRVRVETIGRSDEDRELVVVWVSSDENIAGLQRNRENLARIADPRGVSDVQVRELIATTRPHYHLMGGLHSGETGPSEMLMELVYRLATETSPLVRQIREHVIVSVTPVADPDGRDRNVDWFYQNQELTVLAGASAVSPTAAERVEASGADAPDAGSRRRRPSPGRGGPGASPAEKDAASSAKDPTRAGDPPGPPTQTAPPGVPYWGRYVFHDNNRDINLSQVSMRALADWYFTAYPPIMHDLHESLPLLYTYSGAAPQNPNLDPILFAELPFFSNFELAQMTKWGMPGVYTHAFMDGWSPGYLGSIAYNHNGMMRMYETQAARERGASGGGQREGRGGRGGDGPDQAGRGGTAIPTGRGGGQPREWYRGLPVPADATADWSRRNNANYMQTAVLSALQLTSMFPNLVVENFARKTLNAIEAGRTEPPHGFVFPVQRDMTRVAELVNLLRVQRIEVGRATRELKLADGTFPAGSYVIKRDQPYGRLAKNLLERQEFPDPNLRTYDDSGWTMGLAMLVEVKEIKDKAILEAATTPVTEAFVKGRTTGVGTAGVAVAHLGSNNMIAFRYRLSHVPMKIAAKSFRAGGTEFPAGSFVVPAPADPAAVRQAVEELGLTAAALAALPSVPMHEADVPRVAIYSSWTGTQETGWVRFTFDRFGLAYDLIHKERVRRGNLRQDYDVIVLPSQPLNRLTVFQASAPRPVPYLKTDKYRFLGMYGESADITGGMGGEGVDAFLKFLDSGGTLLAMGNAVRFPSDLGLARTVDATGTTSPQFYAPRPLVRAEIVRPDHPVFYGYADRLLPVKYIQGQPLMSIAQPDQGHVLGRYVGGDEAVLSGLMRGAAEIRSRPFAIDAPGGYTGKGRVVLFSNNPIYRWQNHGEFNMVFNTLLNWNDLPDPPGAPGPTTNGQ
ncbi:MAG TPA: M14 family zinc carboxypeptidase [Vicinamibacterales bacterium]|nr:M14 family zinc carboxypeptidase [Vicinamibacterales bacterium]